MKAVYHPAAPLFSPWKQTRLQVIKTLLDEFLSHKLCRFHSEYRDGKCSKWTDGAKRNEIQLALKNAAVKPLIVQRWIHPPNPVTMRQWLHTFQEAPLLNLCITRFAKPKSPDKWAGNSLYKNFLRLNHPPHRPAESCAVHVEVLTFLLVLNRGFIFTALVHFRYRHNQRGKWLLFSLAVICWTPALHLGVNNLSK